MITLNIESRNPMGRVYAENRLKTKKLLGVKGLNKNSTGELPLFPNNYMSGFSKIDF